MFSKALFKQSCKANGTMWAIITVALCFMLACVMLISGGGAIGDVKDSIQDTIIVKEIDSQLDKRAINYYANATDGLKVFDESFAENLEDTTDYLTWLQKMEKNPLLYALLEPKTTTPSGKALREWYHSKPVRKDYDSDEEYTAAEYAWKAKTPTEKSAGTAVYVAALTDMQEFFNEKAEKLGYREDSDEALEMLGSALYILNPDGKFNDFYTKNNEAVPETYDVTSFVTHYRNKTLEEYVASAERKEYREDRAETNASIFLAGNMTDKDNVTRLLDALASYGVTEEKYESFGYTYDSLKHRASTAVITYRNRLEYELGRLDRSDYDSDKAYNAAVQETSDKLATDISDSFLSSLPQTVSDALEEIGQMDLYTLIVGSIFYKLAGLLLPIIYLIMASNNLISGQVDSGSMAYVLSTSIKRKTVVVTQAIYLIGSLLAMFAMTTITGCVCLAIVHDKVALTYGKLLLLNLGAFLVLFALSGLCFFTSCYFDRSKRSMAIGGGLSIFSLVAAMLGLFGSPVIPSVIRLDALNFFNYTTVITFFDVVSIMDGTLAFLWKFTILLVAGAIGYAAGSEKFTKKDLPL